MIIPHSGQLWKKKVSPNINCCETALWSIRPLDSLKKNKNLTLLTLERICKYLDCTLDDVVRFL